MDCACAIVCLQAPVAGLVGSGSRKTCTDFVLTSTRQFSECIAIYARHGARKCLEPIDVAVDDVFQHFLATALVGRHVTFFQHVAL